MTTRLDIVDAAKSYVDVKFRHLGRDRLGVDCVGLLVLVSRDLGINVEDTLDYRRIPDGDLFRKYILTQTKPALMENLSNGNILMLKQAHFPCHCGFVSMTTESQPVLIHAAIGARKVVMEPLSNFLRDVVYVRDYMEVY